MRVPVTFSLLLTLLMPFDGFCVADDNSRPLPAGAFASVPDLTLREGDKVPSFEALATDGQLWKSDEHVGKKYVVVFFFPQRLPAGALDRSAITATNCRSLQSEGIEVVGISGDLPPGQQLFHRHHTLNFSLLSDSEGKVARQFGVPARAGDQITRTVDGTDYVLARGVTASRWTFVVGKDGKIARKNTAVDPEKDALNVLETVRRLTAAAE
jgi:peroxiredoxin Q/BCP